MNSLQNVKAKPSKHVKLEALSYNQQQTNDGTPRHHRPYGKALKVEIRAHGPERNKLKKKKKSLAEDEAHSGGPTFNRYPKY